MSGVDTSRAWKWTENLVAILEQNPTPLLLNAGQIFYQVTTKRENHNLYIIMCSSGLSWTTHWCRLSKAKVFYFLWMFLVEKVRFARFLTFIHTCVCKRMYNLQKGFQLKRNHEVKCLRFRHWQTKDCMSCLTETRETYTHRIWSCRFVT